MDDSRGLGRAGPLLVLVVASTVLYGWRLNVSGYANSYYSAAAQAGAQSWKAMLFGSLDAANGITVDKPPLALWPMALSVRLFGLSSWSVLLPQALEGVGSVVLLYLCVRRAVGRTWPAFIAGAVFALTPVSVLVFRYNNPDAMLTLLLLGCAYGTLRAVDNDRPARWLVLVGVLAGLGFLTKMLEAFLVLPALAATYGVYGRPRLLVRTGHLALGGLAIVAAAGWWVAIVELWPARDRPFIGGSPTNSVMQLALGYNGVGRLTGGPDSTVDGGFGATNLARISRTDLGGEITWLLPIALVLTFLAWWLSREHPARARIRASLLLWTGWLAVASTTFLLMAGIFHSYYTVVLAPAIAALVGIGLWLVWDHRHETVVRRWLACGVLGTTLVAVGTVAVVGHQLRWWIVPILLAGIGATVLLLGRTGPRRLAAMTLAAALSVTLIGPVLFSWETVRSAHTGSAPMAGPGHAAATTDLVADGDPFLGVPFLGGASGQVSGEVVATVRASGDGYRWVGATLGARSASAYELALGEPVLAIGGYKGSDPTPTLPEFVAMARTHQVHWFLPGSTGGPAGDAIQHWVEANSRAIAVGGGYTVYDLSGTA